jgi:glycerol-3-phosphate O-acyltransferase/dihydroxyacetone phosphate acyltransferase
MYAVLLCLLTNLELQTIMVMLLCFPLFSYLGVMAVQAGIVDLKDLRPAYLRLLPSFRRECRNLPLMRVALQNEVRTAVRKYGPDLGPLYYATDLGVWEKEHENINRQPSFPNLS